MNTFTLLAGPGLAGPAPSGVSPSGISSSGITSSCGSLVRRSLAVAVATALASLPATAPAQAPGAAHSAERATGTPLLEEIVVTAAPLRQSPLELAQPSAVLTGAALRREIGVGLGETVERQLGVTGTYFGPQSSRPVIRGLGGERVQVLEDGLAVLDVAALSEDHAVAVESLVADQVEILKGPATLLYGSGAVGGVVNVVTNRIPTALPERFEGAVELRGDTATDQRAGAARLDFGAGPLAFHLDGFRRRTDDVRIPGYDFSAAERAEAMAEGEEDEATRGRVPNSDSDARGGAVGMSWIGSRGFLGLAVSRFETEYGVPGHHHHHHHDDHDHDHDHARGTAHAIGRARIADAGHLDHDHDEEEVRIDLRQTRVDLAGELTGDEGWFRGLRWRAAWVDYRHDELEGEEIGTRFDQRAWETRLALDHRLGGWRGTAGLQFRDVDFDAEGEEAFVPPSRTRSLGAFVFEERPVATAAGDVTLALGGRIERQTIDPEAGLGLPDYSGNAWTLSAGVVWRVLPAASLAANLTHAERHPTATALYADGPHLAVQRYEEGDADLGRERVTALDLAVRSAPGALVRWQVNLFLNEFRDFIYLEPTGEEEDGFDVFEYTQADARFWGAEAEATLPLLQFQPGRVDLRLAADFVRGRLRDGGDLPQVPPLRWGGELRWQGQAFTAGVAAFRYQRQTRVAEFERPTDGYTLLDLDLGWRVATPLGGAFVFVRGTNLLDEEARRHTSPLKEYAPLPGRAALAGVRVDF